ncbi:MAG: glutamate--tRNA ligase [Acidobacteria bacterium]|nr:glutamate--tRNA ligase [Acidobacteriota bacterium]
MSGPRVRFAPSPTGHLHLGGARTALVNVLFARREGGRFVLRIEDTDVERNVPGAERSLEDDLRWLGIVPDESPSAGGSYGPYRQSERSAQHREAFEVLRGSGRAYPCFCPAGERSEYRCPRGCANLPADEGARRIAAGEAHAYRFRLIDEEREIEDLLHGRVSFAGAPAPDPVLLRPDGHATFLFAGAVDDAGMAITHVIRGEDHLPNAWKQAQIARALGAPEPRWAHLPLILGPDRSPLSKRGGVTSIGRLREAGFPAEAVVVALAHLGMEAPGIEPGADPWPALVRGFDLVRVSTAPSVHDEGRLEHLSAAWLRALPARAIAERVAARDDVAALFGAAPPASGWWPDLLALCAASRTTLAEAVAGAATFLRWPGAPGEPAATPVLRAWREVWPAGGLPAGGSPSLDELSREVTRRTGARRAELFHPLRVALTGAEQGPALSRLAPLLDAAARGAEVRTRVVPCAERIDRALG